MAYDAIQALRAAGTLVDQLSDAQPEGLGPLSTRKLPPSANLTESQDNAYTHGGETVVAPVLLTPALVEEMIARRQAVQVIKFRTTCTDCLPNF
jgi:hypothetical protein